MRDNRTIPGLIFAVLIVASACSTAPASTTLPASPSGSAGAPPATPSAATSSPAAQAWPAGAPDALLLVGRASDPQTVHVIQASTGETMLDMPAGATPRADWLHEIVATPHGGKTTVGDILVQPGLGGPEVSIDGAWRLPTIGYDPTPVGLSADGSTAVLVEAAPAAAGPAAISRFAILNIAPLEANPKIVELRGSFDYDAISADGRVLYVVEHLAGPDGSYQVRAVDLPAGALREAVIADKRNLGEAMAGWPIGQVRAPSGIVFTLYNGLEHPFIHALSTADGWAVCIDLPAAGAAGAGDQAALDWGLAASPDWHTVYAANAALGHVSVVDAAELTVRQSVAIDVASRAPAITLAKFGHEPSGPVGRRTVVAQDGKTAYSAGPNGILAIQTADLTIRSRLLEGSSVDAIGLTPDGRALFALLHDGGRIVGLDPATGMVIGTVPGEGYDRIISVVPW